MSLMEQMLKMVILLLGCCVSRSLVLQRFETEKEKFKLDTVSKGKLMEHIKNAS